MVSLSLLSFSPRCHSSGVLLNGNTQQLYIYRGSDKEWKRLIVTLAPQVCREVIGKPISPNFTSLVFRSVPGLLFFLQQLLVLGFWELSKSVSFLGSHMISALKSEMRGSMPWQQSKVWRPHRPSALNSFYVKSKFILRFWKPWRRLTETAVDKPEKEAPPGREEAPPLSFLMAHERHHPYFPFLLAK